MFLETKHHELGGLIPQKCVISQFWRLGVQGQGVRRGGSEGQDLLQASPLSFSQFAGGLWHFLGHRHKHNLYLRPLIRFSPCVSMSKFPFFIRTAVTFGQVLS